MPEDPGENPPGEITQWLHKWEDGDPQALDELIRLVEGDLQRLAHAYLQKERRYHTMDTRTLVQEAFLRFCQSGRLALHDSKHFFGIAARLMRQVLVDNARRHQANRRGGAEGVILVTLNEARDKAETQYADVLALHEALTDLERLDPLKGRIVELHIFGGLTLAETAEELGLTISKVKSEWERAKLLLRGALTVGEEVVL